MIKLTLFAFLACFASLTFAGVDLPMLIAQPQFAPETTTVTRELKFAKNFTIKAGTKMNVVGIRKDGVSIAFPGKPDTYGVSADALTLLADADAYIATLTPEQQKLTVADMVARKELWPYKVTVKGMFKFGGGKLLKTGDVGVLREFNGKTVTLYFPQENGNYTLPVDGTSILKDCLASVVTPQKMSAFYNELKDNCLDFPTNQPTKAFDDGGPEYVALYDAAGWCPFCAQVNDDVVKWFKDNEGAKKRIQLILVSCDKTEPDRAAYMQKLGIEIPYVKVKGFDRMPFLQETKILEGLPYLLIVDKTGKTIAGESNAQPKERTLAALAKMTEMVQAPAKP